MATDAATFATMVVTDLREQFLPAMQQEAEAQRDEIRQLISVPVQYVAPFSQGHAKPAQVGSRAGPGLVQRDARAPGIHFTYVNGKLVQVVRSKPGEPPRKEFGFLYKSMTAEVTSDGDRIISSMYSDDDIAGYAARLEERMSRPHFSTVFANVERFAADRILSRLPQTL